MAEAWAVPGTARVWASPFRRTLDTAKALAMKTGCRVRVHPELYEEGVQRSSGGSWQVGGVYTESGGRREGPGTCMSAADIERDFPGFDVSLLPRSGGSWRALRL